MGYLGELFYVGLLSVYYVARYVAAEATAYDFAGHPLTRELNP